MKSCSKDEREGRAMRREGGHEKGGKLGCLHHQPLHKPVLIMTNATGPVVNENLE
jgi:hypothetical protein